MKSQATLNVVMRDTKINVLYYPDFAPAAEATLKKALLLFDELHVMDRPSFSFGQGQHGGLIGAPSPFRDFETFFKNEGIPIYVHHAPGGPVPDEFYEQIKAGPTGLANFVHGIILLAMNFSSFARSAANLQRPSAVFSIAIASSQFAGAFTGLMD